MKKRYLLVIVFTLLFYLELFCWQRVLASQTFSNSTVCLCTYKIYSKIPQETFINSYISELKKVFKDRGIILDISFLNTGNCTFEVCSTKAELTAVVIDGKVSLDWKVKVNSEKAPRIFNVEGDVKNVKKLALETVQEFETLFKRHLVIEDIKIEGNLKIGDDLIFQQISVQPGDPFDLEKIDQDLRAIYDLGYFENVEAIIENGTTGIILIFRVKEFPSVKKIVFKGNKEIDSSDLEQIIGIKKGDLLSYKKLDKAIENIKLYYEHEGFRGTQVKIKTKKVSPTQVELTFQIKEGKKLYIKKIIFIGNRAFSDSELKEMLGLCEKRWYTFFKKFTNFFKNLFRAEPLPEPGVYNKLYLYRGLSRIEVAYKNKGYIDVKIGEPVIEIKKNWVTIKIYIKEGLQYKVGKIEVVQDLFPQKVIKENIKLKTGEIFSLQKMKEDEIRLRHLFADYGYAFAKIDTKIKKIPEKKLLNITYVIKKGPVVFINRIIIEGNYKTRDKVIRRELLIAENWPYSESRIERSVTRLRRLGFFKSVKIKKERGVRPDEINLRVKVEEMLTGSFNIGAGYSSTDKFIFMANIVERNLFGTGKRVSISARLGSFANRYSINYFDPYLFDTRYSFGWSLFNYILYYEDFTKDSKGFSLRIGYDFTPELSGYVSYSYDRTDLEDISENASSVILQSKDINITSAVKLGTTYNSLDRFFFPTRGWYHSLSAEFAERLWGSKSNFEKFVALHQVYFPVWKFTGHIKLGYGYITEGADKRIPVYDRFFLGGINSVRGFRYGTISPVDPETGERIGGTRMAYVQVENRFPISKSVFLYGVVFFDAGTVWTKDDGFKTSEIKKSVGFGFRWLSPIGPLRFEWGFNIDRKPGEDKSNFNFQIGGFF